MNLLMCAINFVRLSYAVIKARPILVHYHTSRRLALVKDMVLAFWLRHFLRVKTVLHIRNSDPDSILISKRPRPQRLQLWALQHCCDRLIFLSENVVNALAETLGDDAGARFRLGCTVMHNFTLLRDSYRTHDRAGDCANLFFIGNIGREKGIYDLIEAARHLRELQVSFKVVLAGPFDSDREEHSLRKMVARYHLDEIIVFLGPVYGKRKEEAFLQADIYVLPSYSEGIPQSMLEAMAYGLPVVVSDVGGIPEVVRDGEEGVIVKPGDIGGLCRALQKLVGSVECRQRMGIAGRRRIALHYGVDDYMRQLENLYDSLLVSPTTR